MGQKNFSQTIQTIRKNGVWGNTKLPQEKQRELGSPLRAGRSTHDPSKPWPQQEDSPDSRIANLQWEDPPFRSERKNTRGANNTPFLTGEKDRIRGKTSHWNMCSVIADGTYEKKLI